MWLFEQRASTGIHTIAHAAPEPAPGVVVWPVTARSTQLRRLLDPQPIVRALYIISRVVSSGDRTIRHRTHTSATSVIFAVMRATNPASKPTLLSASRSSGLVLAFMILATSDSINVADALILPGAAVFANCRSIREAPLAYRHNTSFRSR